MEKLRENTITPSHTLSCLSWAFPNTIHHPSSHAPVATAVLQRLHRKVLLISVSVKVRFRIIELGKHYLNICFKITQWNMYWAWNGGPKPAFVGVRTGRPPYCLTCMNPTILEFPCLSVKTPSWVHSISFFLSYACFTIIFICSLHHPKHHTKLLYTK